MAGNAVVFGGMGWREFERWAEPWWGGFERRGGLRLVGVYSRDVVKRSVMR